MPLLNPIKLPYDHNHDCPQRISCKVLESLTLYKWIRDAFMMADKNNDEKLDFEEVTKLLKQLNADMDKKHIQNLFDVSIS
jgi:Ca2+-binding EF-hand superfamily protein